MTTEAGEEDQMVKAVKAVQELHNIRNTYFPKNQNDRIEKLRSQLVLALELVASIPLEERIDPALRAMNEYVKGEMFNIIPDYCKEAEDHLSQAVNLNPSLVEAWLSLGRCMLKKGDLPAAKNCFTLALKEGPNKEILCQLSMLTRKMAQEFWFDFKVGTENQAELIEESILHARKALSLDVKYGSSWYNLGNSYLTSFFATGAVDRSKLTQSLKAYQNAVKDKGLKSNPDLYFHFAIAHRYMENFERALTGFEAAAALWDRDHKVSASIQNVINQIDKLDNALKGHARVKKSTSLTLDLTSLNRKLLDSCIYILWLNCLNQFVPALFFSSWKILICAYGCTHFHTLVNTSYRMVTIDALSEGLNKGVAVLGNTLSFIEHEITPPMYYVICDSGKECFVLSLFRIQFDMIKTGDQLMLIEPFYYHYDFSWKEKEYKFKLIRLDDLSQLIVNGKNLFPREAVVTTSTHAHDKP